MVLLIMCLNGKEAICILILGIMNKGSSAQSSFNICYEGLAGIMVQPLGMDTITTQ